VTPRRRCRPAEAGPDARGSGSDPVMTVRRFHGAAYARVGCPDRRRTATLVPAETVRAGAMSITTRPGEMAPARAGGYGLGLLHHAVEYLVSARAGVVLHDVFGGGSTSPRPARAGVTHGRRSSTVPTGGSARTNGGDPCSYSSPLISRCRVRASGSDSCSRADSAAASVYVCGRLRLVSLRSASAGQHVRDTRERE
jgi:hypothetical protein